MRTDRPARSSSFARRAAYGCTAVVVLAGGLLVATPAFALTQTWTSFSDLQADLDNQSATQNDIARLGSDVSGGTLHIDYSVPRILDLAGHTLTLDTLQLTTIVGGAPDGANLTIIDSSGAGARPGTGHLVVNHTSDGTTAAIEVDSASSLTVKQAVVDATVPSSGTAAAIGGGGLVDNYTTPRDVESAGTIDIADGSVVTATGSASGAAIGGGRFGSGGTITIEQTAKVTATGQGGAAAIGTGESGTTGSTSVTINGYGANARGGVGVDVQATATGRGAAIGGGYQGAGGTVDITGYSTVSASSDEAGIGDGEFATGSSQITIDGYSTVNAHGGSAGGAGIGGSNTAYGNDQVSIGGNSTVTATGTAGPGIGGERNRYATTVGINGAANVHATGGGNGAAIGGGDSAGASYQSGANLTLGDTADLTVGTGNSAISAIGAGAGSGIGSIGLNGGTLHLASGQQITVPSGSTFTNSAVVQNAGSISTTGSGVIDNEGIVLNTGSVSGTVKGLAYSLAFHSGAGSLSGGGDTEPVFADTVQRAQLSMPTATPSDPGKFVGWNTSADGSGSYVDGSKSLSALAQTSTGTPVVVPLYAIYQIDPVMTTAGLPQATVGSQYAGSVGVTAGTAPLTYSYTGSLPAGLSLDGTSGAITGTPTVSGTYSIKVTAQNGSSSASRIYPLTVIAAPLTVSAARTAAHNLPHLGGSTMSVTIGGLEANEPYSVVIAGKTVLAGNAQQFGAFTKSVVIPTSVADGTHTVVVSGSKHGATSSATILTAAVKKALIVKASTSKPKSGKKLTITVSHLYASEAVHIVVKGPHGESVAAKGSSKGVYVLTLKHGLPKKGKYTIVVAGATTGRTSTLHLTVK